MGNRRLQVRQRNFHLISSGLLRLIHSGELHVGLRDFDDDVPIGDSFRLELDVNFEIRAVLTDKCFSLKSCW